MDNRLLPADSIQGKKEFVRRVIYDTVNTSLPGEIVEFDSKQQTATVKCCIRSQTYDPQLQKKITKDLPLIFKAPVWFPYTITAGFSLNYEVNPGDQCLLIFSQRSFDNWLVAGSVQDTIEPFQPRCFSLTDAIVLVGLIPNPNAIQNFISKGIELRNKDRSVHLHLLDDKLEINISVDNGASAGCNEVYTIAGDLTSVNWNDRSIHVGKNLTLLVDGQYSETIIGNVTLAFSSNVTEGIIGNYELTVSGSFNTIVASGWNIQAMMSVNGRVKSTSYSTIDNNNQEKVGVTGTAGPNSTVTFINGLAIQIS